jgi:peptidoglycan/xylan/chitin deacetylase (PgdA/CDA1 family)
MSLIHRLFALAAAFFLIAAAPAQIEIAVTYDDLPAPDAGADTDWLETSTKRLLRGLKRHKVPAVGFVNERGLGGPDRDKRIRLLDAWLAAGMELANHSHSHFSLTETAPDIWIPDVARGATVTRSLMAKRGMTLRYFRHPYLHTGASNEVRRTVDKWLAENNYITAPVTIENGDWIFATVYADALRRGDRRLARRATKTYLDYTDARIGWYLKASEQVFGRQPRHILLLHANRLNADTVDEMVAVLRRRGLRIVTLERALADPVYAIPDPYIGPHGIGWVQRAAMALGKPDSWDESPSVPTDIQAIYDKGIPANQWPE